MQYCQGGRLGETPGLGDGPQGHSEHSPSRRVCARRGTKGPEWLTSRGSARDAHSHSIEARSEDAGSSESSDPGKARRREVDGVSWGSTGMSVPLLLFLAKRK